MKHQLKPEHLAITAKIVDSIATLEGYAYSIQNDAIRSQILTYVTRLKRDAGCIAAQYMADIEQEYRAGAASILLKE